jgi:3-methyl-2-oxobutanoate hydroxymethyltransferase
MRKTILDIQRMKSRGERITMITCYDYTSAQLVDRSGIPLVLVGDTLGMVVLGYSSTIPVTLDDMLHHMKAVARGSTEALLVGDLPFLTYASEEEAVRSAGRVMQEGSVQAVKLEGGRSMAPIVRRIVALGIPVMAHIGLTPQSVNQLGGMRVQGKQADDARRLIEDAQALEEAGAFSLVLELVPAELSREISQRLRIPTIGIGAGPWCDGQVQVWHDLLGLYSDFVPRHSHQYAHLGDVITDALTQYRSDVESGEFPTLAHGSTIKQEELREALRQLDQAG